MNTPTLEDRFRDSIDRVYRELGLDAFACWFDCGAGEKNLRPRVSDAEYAFRSGFRDFWLSVMQPPLPGWLQDTRGKTCLEIGCGGGRLLHAAAHYFDHATGVDIHNQLPLVADLLAARGRTNVAVTKGDGRTLPAPDASVDFVYSVIVFVHLSGPDVFESYVRETYRVLRPGGYASLAYGRPYSYRTKFSNARWKRRLYALAEVPAEWLLQDVLGTGYRTFSGGEANAVTLSVSRRKAESVARAAGFTDVRLLHGLTLQSTLILKKN